MLSVKTSLKKVIPYPFHFYLQNRRPAEIHKHERQDLVSFIVDDNIRFDIYIKGPTVAKSGVLAASSKHPKSIKQGIGLIVNILGEEAIRFDCYEGAGHFHPTVIRFNSRARTFLLLPDKPLSAQIDRATFEIGHNIDWYIQHHPLKKIRRVKVSRKSFQKTTEEAREKMLEYAHIINTMTADIGAASSDTES